MTFDAAQKMQEAQSLHQQGQLDLAKSIYEEILSHQPQNADALHFLGLLYHQKKENDRALSLMEQSLQLSPDNPIYFANCGMVHKAKGGYQRALACYDRSLELNSDSARTRTNRGNVLASLGLFSEALLEHEKALQLDPGLPEIYNNQGSALQSLRRFEESLSSYQRAIELNPLYAEAYLNRGIAQKSLGQNHLAMESFKRAIQLSQNNPRLFHARADLYFDGGFLSEALQDYEKVLALESDAEGALGNLMFVKRRLCLWDGFAQDYSRLEKLVCVDHQRTIPWAFLSYTDSLRVLQQVNELEARVFKLPVEQQVQEVVPFSAPIAKSKIRIAYCSPDFKEHPVGYLFIGLLEAHNREAFEFIGVSLGPPVTDDLRRRFQDSFDRFIDAHTLTDLEVANLLRREQVDILVDLAGWTTNFRMGIFAHRGAPVQVNFLGYASTTGLKEMDYMIADHVVIPKGSESFYTEKVVRLPCYLPRDEKKFPSARRFRREKEGLPYRGFVFCCFNNSYKFNAEVFDSWARILLAVPQSSLWLSVQSPAVAKNLTQELAKRGIQESRCVFAQRLDRVEDHLARHELADLFLDTFPYNAHTTASDALWSGLPVLTRAGESFASRVAASLLTALGLTELIVQTPAEYEAKAIELATQPKKLREIKAHLEERKTQSSVFKMKRFAENIEAAYRAMVARYLAGQSPDNIEIKE